MGCFGFLGYVLPSFFQVRNRLDTSKNAHSCHNSQLEELVASIEREKVVRPESVCFNSFVNVSWVELTTHRRRGPWRWKSYPRQKRISKPWKKNSGHMVLVTPSRLRRSDVLLSSRTRLLSGGPVCVSFFFLQSTRDLFQIITLFSLLISRARTESICKRYANSWGLMKTTKIFIENATYTPRIED